MELTNITSECSNSSSNCTMTVFRCGIPPFLPPTVPEVFHYIQGGIWTIFFFCSLFLNGFVIFLVLTYSTLHHREFFLTLQLNVTHFIFSLTILPTMISNAFAGHCLYGFPLCQVIGVFHDLYITGKFFLTLVMTLDRFFIIFMPYFYYKHGGVISALMSTTAWLISLIRVTTLFTGPLDCYTYLPLFKVCTGAGTCSRACQIHVLMFSTSLAVFCMVLPFVIYIVLFCKARKMEGKMKHSLHNPLAIDTENNNFTLKSDSSQPNNKPSFLLRHKRVFTTFLILAVALIGCAIPPYILYALSFIVSRDILLHPAFSVIQMLIGRTLIYSLSVIDPLIIMRNKDVKDLLQKLWRRRKEKRRYSVSTSHKTNRIPDSVSSDSK